MTQKNVPKCSINGLYEEVVKIKKFVFRPLQRCVFGLFSVAGGRVLSHPFASKQREEAPQVLTPCSASSPLKVDNTLFHDLHSYLQAKA